MPHFYNQKGSCDHRTLKYKYQKLDSKSVRITIITAKISLATTKVAFHVFKLNI